MGQVANPEFVTAFELTTGFMSTKELRKRQIVGSNFDNAHNVKLEIGTYNQTINNVLRKLGEIWMAGHAEEESDENKYCNGQALSIEEYPSLFALWGYTFGGEEGFFNMPNMASRSPIGAGDDYAIGDTTGTAIQDFAHTHNLDIDISLHNAEASGLEGLVVTIGEEELIQELAGTDSVDVDLLISVTMTSEIDSTTYNGAVDGQVPVSIVGTTSTELADTPIRSAGHDHDVTTTPVWVEIGEEAVPTSTEVADHATYTTSNETDSITPTLSHAHDVTGDGEADVTHSHTIETTGDVPVAFTQEITFGPWNIDFTHAHSAAVTGGLDIDIDPHEAVGTAESEELLFNMYHPSLAVQFLARVS